MSGSVAGRGAGGGGDGDVGREPLHDSDLFQEFPHPDSDHLVTAVIIVKQERVLLGAANWENGESEIAGILLENRMC